MANNIANNTNNTNNTNDFINIEQEIKTIKESLGREFLVSYCKLNNKTIIKK